MQRNLDIRSGANNKNISWVVVQFLILITQGCCELFELQVASWGLRCCSARVHVMCPCVFFHKFQLCLPLLGRAAPRSAHTWDPLWGWHGHWRMLLSLLYATPVAVNLKLSTYCRKTCTFRGGEMNCVE